MGTHVQSRLELIPPFAWNYNIRLFPKSRGVCA